MCVGGLANPGDPLGLQGINKTRQAANSMFGWGDAEARGTPTVNVYNQLPGGDIAKADTPGKDSLKLGNK